MGDRKKINSLSSFVIEKISEDLYDFGNSSFPNTIICNDSFQILLCSENCNKMLGISDTTSIIGKNINDLFGFQTTLEKNSCFYTKFSDNQISHFYEVSISQLSDDKLAFMFIDITSEHFKNFDLIRQEKLFEKVEVEAKCGSWYWNINSGENYWSKNHYRIHGLNKKDGVPDFDNYLNLVLPQYRDELTTKLKNAIQKFLNYDIVYKIECANDNSIKVLHSIGVLDKIFEQDILYGITVDITDLDSTEAELKVKVKQLEKFNKFMVGREIKMIELKKEINDLLSRLNLPVKYKIPTNLEE